MITPNKWRKLRDWMAQLEIAESDLQEKFVRGQGKGGQKQNKTANCVVLVHVPTTLSVKCQKTRSREDNRYHARKLLCQQIDLIRNGKNSLLQQRQQKVKAQKLRRQRRKVN